MIPKTQVWEKIIRRTPFGVHLWDMVTATDLIDGLEIEVSLRKYPQHRVRAFVNRSGVYYVHGLPGLRDFEQGVDFGQSDKNDIDVWKEAVLRAYRVEVRDPSDRFQPFTFDADMPIRGLFNWMGPLTSPIESLVLPTDNGSPPASRIGRIPLFSSPSRQVSGTFATVRSQLRENGTDRPAAWCLLAVSIDKIIRGIGLADKEGRVVIIFPYPKRSRPVLTSPLSAINDFRWNLELTAYYVSHVSRPKDVLAPDIPDLAEILDQLNSPCVLLPESSQLWIEYGRSLTVRSQDSSFLFVNTV